MKLLRPFLTTLLLSISLSAAAEPLKIGYSDWPGWVAWEIAIEKGWFEEAGVDVEFEWFDYVASMDAFAAGQLDAVSMTNGDTLVTGAAGAAGVMIILNDYSNGNDMIVARSGISSVSELKGKTIGVEIGFVSHLLLLNALESVGLDESDVELMNVPTNETPQVLASGDVDAIVAWQPNSSLALNALPGSTAIYTSADEPGLIYDMLTVSPASLATRKPDWMKVIDVWYQVVDFLMQPETQAEATAIMAARVGLTAEEYLPFMAGTKILTRDEAAALLKDAEGFKSVYSSTQISDDFNVKYGAYAEPQNIDRYIDPSLTLSD
ncbi:MAG: ABC transporter substrate-binding protein [Pseudomonadales bacterium]|nr:ABC transporter substrate-binding protein [Pseudomonadales bacterium]MBO6563187.1 ABC transporter substrate-binding protein [Pseudomonadales bacterium]MBO6597274.1 ABC transporter substrate-binding protein [Pseudomonadales bacterium]MBO6656901.1 ABC transporter substrate-binding protein [Pseudomonadales bacterium]MBO6703903.1 ABC transporter substrate-binding protein [Pseudomonadales bacterium]